jgi:hypothetical protein
MVASAVFVAIASFPTGIAYLEAGLDPSWSWALNALSRSSYVFGTDVAFTYGPLGYLAAPHDMGSNVGVALALRLGLQAILVSVLIATHRATQARAPQLLLFTVGFLAVEVLFPDFEAHVFIVAAALGLGMYRLKSRTLAVVAGGLFPIVALLKTTCGVIAAALFAPLLVLWLLEDRRGGLAALAAALASFSLVFGVLAARLFGSLETLASWLRLSQEFASGYSEAMAFPGPRRQLVAALVLWVLTVTWLGARETQERRAGLLAIALSPAIFMLFKRGFVRQDEHVYTFFSSLAALVLLLLLQTRGAALRACGVALAVAAVISGGAIEARDGALPPRVAIERATGYFGATVLIDWLTHRPGTAAEIPEDRLPSEWVDAIRASGGELGVMPFELNICPANGLTLHPNPTLQSYSAYTRRLDGWDAEFLASARAPPFMVVEFKAIDGRNPYVDTPASWRSLIANYEVRDSRGERTLLARRPQPRERVGGELSRQVARTGQWVEVPLSSGMVEAAIELPLTFAGRVERSLFRTPHVVIEAVYEDGIEARYVVVVDTLANGLAVSHLPRNLGELTALLAGHATPRVTKFRLTGEGATRYGPELQIVWRRSFSWVGP